MTKRGVRGGLLGSVIALSIVVLGVSAAWAADLVVPISTVVRAPIGSTVALVTVPSGDAEGQTCEVTAIGENQPSVHLDNNLIVSSVNSVTMFDVERAPNAVTPANGLLTLNDSIMISVFIGNEDQGNGIGIFSGALTVEFDCDTTSTTTTTTSTTTPSSSSTSTSSTTPATTVTSTASTTPPSSAVAAGEQGDTSAPSETTAADSLPVTGSGGANTLMWSALALVVVGALLAAAARRRTTLSTD